LGGVLAFTGFIGFEAAARRGAAPFAPAINIAEYGKFARVSANFNQLVRLAHEGRSVTIHEDMIRALLVEVSRLLGPARSTGVKACLRK
jgi:hypothetical protein